LPLAERYGEEALNDVFYSALGYPITWTRTSKEVLAIQHAIEGTNK
jgi:hypothetical protein